jgi:protein-S-isoprenylcysteine O-methyltransferase Ste14
VKDVHGVARPDPRGGVQGTPLLEKRSTSRVSGATAAVTERRYTEPVMQAILVVPIYLLLMGVMLFASAGRLRWARGWWFLGVLIVCMVGTMVYLWWVNPEIYAARRSIIGEGTKAWDLVLMPLLLALLLGIFIVAALDDGRYHWLPTPDWVVWLGYVLVAAGFWLTAWAQAVNRHFEPSVRIQTDRDHRVVDTGPYAIIRHPGYAACIPLGAGFAFGLGSVWALIPAVLLQALLAYRTLREEEALRAELPGYSEYVGRVEYRWIPGIW